jgi:glycosyl transferase family 25
MTSKQVPVYYINIAARTDRRQFMESQFAQLGVEAERVDATIASQVPAELAYRARDPDGTLRIGIAEIACTLSHFAAWRRAIEMGADACMVFEDDGILSPVLPSFLQALGPSLPDNIDLLKVETTRNPVRLGRQAKTLGGLTLRPLTSTHYGACGYVISARFARQLISSMPLVPLPFDDYAFARHGALLRTRRVYQSDPALVVQLVNEANPQSNEVAGSDLERIRDDKRRQLPHKRQPRLLRLSRNLAAAWRELRAFGFDALRSRAPINFAEDLRQADAV